MQQTCHSVSSVAILSEDLLSGFFRERNTTQIVSLQIQTVLETARNNQSNCESKRYALCRLFLDSDCDFDVRIRCTGGAHCASEVPKDMQPRVVNTLLDDKPLIQENFDYFNLLLREADEYALEK
jgi:hypothetical protein